MDELRTQLRTLLDAGAWTPARWMIQARLLRAPDDHKLLAHLALTWLGEDRAPEARDAIDKAALLAPGCPEVLFIRSAVLEAQGETCKAVAVLRALTERGAKALTRGECRMDRDRAVELVAVGLLRLAQLHRQRGELEQHDDCARRHLAMAEAGAARVNVQHRFGARTADALWRRLRGPSERRAAVETVH